MTKAALRAASAAAPLRQRQQGAAGRRGLTSGWPWWGPSTSPLRQRRRSVHQDRWGSSDRHRLGDLGGEVLALLLDALTDLEAHEATDGDLLADLGAGLADQITDALLVVLHPILVHEADRLEELVDLPLDDLLEDVLRLLLIAELGHVDLLLLGDLGLGDLLTAHVLRSGGGDVHGHLLHEVLEVRVAGDEVGLAVDLDHHADLAVVDVAAHEAFGGNATGLARLAADPLLAQPLLRLGEVAVGL